MRSEDEGDQTGTPPAEVEALRNELVRIKEEKNLSLDAFAHDTQYSRSSWNRVLKGTGFPPRDAIVRLCARRRLDPEHLLALWETADTARRTPAPAPAAAAPSAPPAGQPPAGQPAAPEESPSADTQNEPSAPTTSAPNSARPTAAATTKTPVSAVPLGAEGRKNCNYNSDRTQTMAKVSQLQCFLDYNYDNNLNVDGKFGTSTETAVKAVQQCSGINVDGQVGPQTWKYLEYPMPGCGH